MALPSRLSTRKEEEKETSTTSQEPTAADLELIAMQEKMAKMKAELDATKTAVAVIKPKPAGDVEASTGPIVPSIFKLQDAMDPAIYGAVRFPGIKGSNGNLTIPGGSLGTKADVQVYSWSWRHFVVPVAPESDKNARRFCRASYDGKIIPGRGDSPEMTIDEYKASISDYYEEVKIVKYIDVYCLVFSAEKGLDLAEKLGIFQLQIAPLGQAAFNSFIVQTDLTVARGQMLRSHQNCMRIVANLDTNQDKKEFVRMSFEPVPKEICEGYTPVLFNV